jgi:hypothetical protein
VVGGGLALRWLSDSVRLGRGGGRSGHWSCAHWLRAMAGIDAGEGAPAPPPEMSPQQRIEQVRRSLVKPLQSRSVAVFDCRVLFRFLGLPAPPDLLVRGTKFANICWSGAFGSIGSVRIDMFTVILMIEPPMPISCSSFLIFVQVDPFFPSFLIPHGRNEASTHKLGVLD